MMGKWILEIQSAEVIAAEVKTVEEVERVCRKIDDWTGNAQKCVQVIKQASQHVDGLSHLLQSFQQYSAYLYTFDPSIDSFFAFQTLDLYQLLRPTKLNGLFTQPKLNRNVEKLAKRLGLLTHSEALQALNLINDDELLIDLFRFTSPRQLFFQEEIEDFILSKAVESESSKTWVRFMVDQPSSFPKSLLSKVSADHVPFLSDLLTLCKAEQIPEWLDVFEQADIKRVWKKLICDYVPELASQASLIVDHRHDPNAVEAVLKKSVGLDNLEVVKTAQQRLGLVSGDATARLCFWCVENYLKSVSAPPYLSKSRLPLEFPRLIEQLDTEHQSLVLTLLSYNRLPLNTHYQVLLLLVRAGYSCKAECNFLVQKIALLPLLQESDQQQQVFEATTEATLVQVLLEFLQSHTIGTIDWKQLFTLPELFTIGQRALQQTVQYVLNMESLEGSIEALKVLLEAGLPPQGLVEVYYGCIAVLTKSDDTLKAARLGRLLESSLSEYMTIEDRQLVASLNTAVAMEICELCMQGNVDMATARCQLYEGKQAGSESDVLREFLEARAGLPFAREALERIGGEKGWRSYLKLFGRVIAEDLTLHFAHLYGDQDLDQHDIIAAKTTFLPPVFSEDASIALENWYSESYPRLASPFNGVEMDILLKSSDDDDKRFSTRCLIEAEMEESDCLEYIDHVILGKTFATSIPQAADFFKIPATVIKGLVLMNHLPIHAFPQTQFMSRALQQGLFEAFLSEVKMPASASQESPSLADLPESVRPYMSEEGVVVYPSSFKILVLQKIMVENWRVSELAKVYDLNTCLINNWRRAYRANKPVDTSKSQVGHCTKHIIRAYQQLLSSN